MRKDSLIPSLLGIPPIQISCFSPDRRVGHCRSAIEGESRLRWGPMLDHLFNQLPTTRVTMTRRKCHYSRCPYA